MFRGAMEYGPHALGRRSILADPGHPEMRDHRTRDRSLNGPQHGFQRQGQPIVNRPEEALSTFLATEIDFLFMEDFFVGRRCDPVPSDRLLGEELAELP
jgi:predicted NodU family carbamoyl transferase